MWVKKFSGWHQFFFACSKPVFEKGPFLALFAQYLACLPNDIYQTIYQKTQLDEPFLKAYRSIFAYR